MEDGLYPNLLAILWRYRRRFSIALAMVFASNGLLVYLPLFFRQAILSLSPATAESGEGIPFALARLLGPYAQSMAVWVSVLVGLAMLSGYYMYRMRVEFVSVSRDVERLTRSMLFQRIQQQSRAFYDRHAIGDLMSMLTTDVAAYREVLGPGIMYPLYFGTMIIPALFALYSISPSMAAISVVPILLLPLFVLVTQRRVYQKSMEVQELMGQMSTYAQEHFAAIRLVKSTANEEPFLNHFNAMGHHYFCLNIWLAAIRGVFFPFLTLLTRVVTVVLVVYAGHGLYSQWMQVSSADFVSFMWIQSNVFVPVLMLGWVLPIYQRGSAAYQRMRQLYGEPIEVVDAPSSMLQVPPHADIQIRHLNFSYPSSQTLALKDVSLELTSARFVGIAGPLGSGKTTLFRLLNREYEIPRGVVQIAGHDIRDYSLNALHSAMVVVEQSPFLFSRTVAENVGMGCEAYTMDDIEGVAQLTDLHESVLSFPMQYETVVGERGVRLSGGQRQRVALARALMVNRPILLLDDVFSAIDATTEEKIFSQLRHKLVGKMVIVVTHRATLLQRMDRVLYFHEGQIVEDGTPQHLLAQRGRFAALVELQDLSQNERAQ